VADFPEQAAVFIPNTWPISAKYALVLADTLDAYSKEFDKARRCARFGESFISWEVAYGRLPNEDDLVISRRFDEYGPLDTKRLYEYQMGMNARIKSTHQ
jgi:hypothetical protein